MYIASLAFTPATGLCKRCYIRRKANLRTAWCLALAAFVVSTGYPVAAQV